MTPMISVVMPVYNAEKYVAEAIESILNQTYSDFEFIIIDDYSTDNSYEIINKYAKADKRIRLFRNEVNKKLPKTLNFGISQSLGKYIARMDADDISLPERFTKQIEFMEQNPDIGVCGSYAEVFYASNGLMKVQLDHGSIKSFTLFFLNNLIHPTLMVRKSIFEYDGLWYDENLDGLAEDYELWIRFLLNGVRFTNLDEVLLKYRSSPNQITNQLKIGLAKFSNQLVIKNLKSLFGDKYHTSLMQHHYFYIQKPVFAKLIFNYYGFLKYKKQFLQANVISKILEPNEARDFFRKIDPFYKIKTKMLNIFHNIFQKM
ncbi:MAG: glycosyltransferase family 2 protein [Burkholderiales bacterium]|nr:glycosyltransferase family 2 protein [Burkholderiales bacterium]